MKLNFWSSPTPPIPKTGHQQLTNLELENMIASQGLKQLAATIIQLISELSSNFSNRVSLLVQALTTMNASQGYSQLGATIMVLVSEPFSNIFNSIRLILNGFETLTLLALLFETFTITVVIILALSLWLFWKTIASLDSMKSMPSPFKFTDFSFYCLGIWRLVAWYTTSLLVIRFLKIWCLDLGPEHLTGWVNAIEYHNRGMRTPFVEGGLGGTMLE